MAEEGGEKLGRTGRLRAYMGASKLNFVIGIIGILIAAGVVVGIPVGYGGYVYMTAPATCGSLCHEHQEYVDLWAESNHAQRGVGCVECHDPVGRGAWASYNANNVVNTLKYFLVGMRPDFEMLDTGERNYAWGEETWTVEGKKIKSWVPTAEDANSRCLRCHEDAFILKGSTRNFDFAEPLDYSNVGSGQTEVEILTIEDKGRLFEAEATNEKNEQGILTLHNLHIQTPTLEEAPWLEYTLREDQTGDWETIGEITCFDCHGFVMLNPEDRYPESFFYDEEASQLVPAQVGGGVGGTAPFILRFSERGGTRQKLPVFVCLQCHDGEKAPGIYGEVGGLVPDEYWLGGPESR